ncbi:hypothetical protein FB451DRAFT_314270 [Mycena latifolia]|nr:hypothetical protein FB451DRAFT_314270 [Mycena latifolia]
MSSNLSIAVDDLSTSNSIVDELEAPVLKFSASKYLESLYAEEEYETAIAVKKYRSKKPHRKVKPEPDGVTVVGLGTVPPEHSQNEMHDLRSFNLPTVPSLPRLFDPSSPSASGPPSLPGQSTLAPAPFSVPTELGGGIIEANKQCPSLVPVKEEEEEEEEWSKARLVPAAYKCSHCEFQTDNSDTSRRSRPHHSKLNGAIICGVCSVYERTHQRARPLSLDSSSAEHPLAALESTSRKVQQCQNCRSTKSSTGWYKSKCGVRGKICKSCYNYEVRTGRRRSQALIECLEARQRLKN